MNILKNNNNIIIYLKNIMDYLCNNLNNMNLDNLNIETELRLKISNDLDKLVNYYFTWNKNKGNSCLSSDFKPSISIINNTTYSIDQLKYYLVNNNNGINIFISKIYEINISEKINLDLVYYLYNYYYNIVFYNIYNKF